jgi:hypothetical protein
LVRDLTGGRLPRLALFDGPVYRYLGILGVICVGDFPRLYRLLQAVTQGSQFLSKLLKRRCGTPLAYVLSRSQCFSQ